ncbi:hypothetical protein Tco_0456582 [Tanacetum coccineum]
MEQALGHPGINRYDDYFFNNDLEYLKSSDPERTYTTSITKTKAAQYEIEGIEDMMNKFSKHNVYSTKKILESEEFLVSQEETTGYGQVEEFMVCEIKLTGSSISLKKVISWIYT